MSGASTVAHTSRDSPSVTALPPDEGVELADVDSLRDGRSMSHHSESEHASMPSEGGRRASLTGWHFGLMILVPYTRFLHTNRMRDPFG